MTATGDDLMEALRAIPERQIMILRRHLSNTKREALWNDCRCDDATGNREDYPRCNIPGCGSFVTPGQKWVESHYPVPAAHGGEVTGVAHKRCNDLYWRNVEAPMMAHVTRARQKHRGIYRPRVPFRGWRRFDGTAVFSRNK